MNVDRLRALIELSRLGSMRAVAEVLHTTTSTVSQQIAALSREMGIALIEPEGRNVRLTASGHRLVERGIRILDEIESAHTELAGRSETVGRVRVAGFLTGLRRSLLPAMAELGPAHPALELRINEHEPIEALALLAAGRVDLAIVYDYTLAPTKFGPAYASVQLWMQEWGLAVPADDAPPRTGDASPPGAPEFIGQYRDSTWIGNSRNEADEDAIAVLAASAGFTPSFGDRCDDLALVEELVRLGRGVALLPLDRPASAGVRVVPLAEPGLRLRAAAVLRKDQRSWAPLAAGVDALLRRSQRPEGADDAVDAVRAADPV